MVDYNEILLTAVDTLIQERISQNKTDKTVVCTIIDDSRAEKGVYTVLQDNMLKFEAYSENLYYKDQQVFVLIQENDYNKTKLILSRYIPADEVKPITYIEPSKQIVYLTDNLIDNSQAFGLIANKKEITTKTVYVKEYETPLNTEMADTILLCASFKTLLENYNMLTGNYGLIFTIVAENDIIYSGTIDNRKDMFGDTYNFNTFLSQEKSFTLNVQDFKEIKSIQISFYQSNNFTYDDGQNNKPQNVKVIEDLENLYVSNLELYLGYNIASVKNHTLQINTIDNEFYNKKSLSKKFKAIWYNKTEDNKYLGFKDGEAHKEFSQENKDSSIIYYWLDWQMSNGVEEFKSIQTDTGDKLLENIIIDCQSKETETWIRCLLYRNGEKIYSNILKFKNQDTYQSGINAQIAQSLKIVNDENALDIYPFYEKDRYLLSTAEKFKSRKLRYQFEDLNAEEITAALEIKEIYWYIPTVGTMLKDPKILDNYIRYEEGDIKDEDRGQKYNCYTLIDSKGNKAFTYNIDNIYNPLYKNNTIKLKIVLKDDRVFEASKTILFTSYGNSGTDYALIIEQEDGEVAQYGDTSINLKASLYGADYETVAESQTIKWYSYPAGKEVSNQDINVNETKEKPYTYTVLQARTTVSWVNGTVDLASLYPVAWGADKNYIYQGPILITYDSTGINPSYYAGELALLNTESELELEWELQVYDTKGELKTLPENPIVSLTKAPVRLKATSMYVSDGNYYVLVCKKTDDNTVLWRQPLIITQNQYSSGILNNWNEKVTIDDSNYVLAPMFGSGTKDTQNRFSGLLMGDIRKADEKGIGLYGYDKGVQTFGLKVDGTGYFGAGNGKISFDGNKSIIYSGTLDSTGINLKEKTKGSLWNLKEGKFLLQGEEGKYFEFTQEDDKAKGYLAGWEIKPNSLINGTLGDKKSIGLFTEDQLAVIKIAEQEKKDWRLTIGRKFGVDADGQLFCNGGNLAGWTIDDNSFRYGNLGGNSNSLWLCRTGTTTSANIGTGTGNEWCITVGNKFGVKKDGTLYASGVNLSGSSFKTSQILIEGSNIYLLDSSGEKNIEISIAGIRNIAGETGKVILDFN